MKKKMRKFDNGGFYDAANAGLDQSDKTPEERALAVGLRRGSVDFEKAVKTLSKGRAASSFPQAHDKAQRFGLEPGSEDYRKVVDSQMRNPAERSNNQALEKVKSTAMAAGKRLMDMTPQGVVAKGVTSMGKKYPRYSEGELAFEQEMGMKKGGKVSSASKRADGIAVKGKTRGRMV
jgi:hypothetical protein